MAVAEAVLLALWRQVAAPFRQVPSGGRPFASLAKPEFSDQQHTRVCISSLRLYILVAFLISPRKKMVICSTSMSAVYLFGHIEIVEIICVSDADFLFPIDLSPLHVKL